MALKAQRPTAAVVDAGRSAAMVRAVDAPPLEALVNPSPLATADTSGRTTVRHDTSGRPGERLCGWCSDSIHPDARADTVYCSQRCRQGAWRFGRGRRLRVASADPMRIAYADPPYPGTAARYYSGHPDFAGEVDHRALISRLTSDWPDGWALSTSAAALPDVLSLCPSDVRVAAWVRGERPTRSYRPLSTWEPVVYWGGRPYLSSIEDRRLDALVHVARARTTDPHRVVGAKPAEFCWWLFDLLGALPGDHLDDLYPGSGGITRAWDAATRHDPSPRTSPTHSRRTDPLDLDRTLERTTR